MKRPCSHQALSLGSLLALLPLLGAGCGSGSDGTTGSPDMGDMSAPGDAATQGDGPGTPPADMRAAGGVKFTYTPQWSGVTNVVVIGNFGQAKDWDPTQPLLTLTRQADGTFTGSVDLPDGQFFYLFQVTGDAAAAAAAVNTLKRYSIDGANPSFGACPAGSPTAGANPNPCSQLTVPPPAASPLYHVQGKVTLGGQAAAGWLVEIERDEQSSHHFFANRTTTGADGTYDLSVATGAWRIQALHPTFYNQTDAVRNPVALAALRRAISSSFAVTADTAVNPVEVAYADYGKLSPQGGTQALPTTFSFTRIAGAANGYVAVYGTKTKDIGDPWYTSPASAMANATVSFNGTFTTAQKMEPQVVPGEQYYWGTSHNLNPRTGLLATWRAESMVFPIKFQ